MWAIKIGISTPFKDRYCTNRPELDLHDWWGYDISIAHILYIPDYQTIPSCGFSINALTTELIHDDCHAFYL